MVAPSENKVAKTKPIAEKTIKEIKQEAIKQEKKISKNQIKIIKAESKA